MINQISIKARIIVLVLLPLLVTLALAAERYYSARKVVDDAKNLEVLQQYITSVSAVISSVYRERLYTKLYLLGVGGGIDPEDVEFRAEMMSSRGPSDEALNQYEAFISRPGLLAPFPRLSENIDRIKQQKDTFYRARELAKLGQKNERDAGTGKNFGVMPHYNFFINSLVDSSQEVVLLSASNKELSKLANAYQNLIYAQDASMLLIGNIYESSAKSLGVNALGNTTRQWGQIQSYHTGFKTFAPEALSSYFDEQLVEPDFAKLTQQLFETIRRVKPNRIGMPIDYDGIEWLKTGEEIIAAYKRVTDRVLIDIENTKTVILSNARSQANQTLIGMVVLLVVTLAVSFKIISSIIAPLKELVSKLETLADTKDMTLRSDVSGKNELTLVGNAFNTLAETFESTLSGVRTQVLDMDVTTTGVSDSMTSSMALIDKQREATDSISVAVNQMTSTIYEVSKMTSSTSEAVKRAYDLSISSENDAKHSKQKMNRLFDELGETSALITDLNSEANQISNILQVIKGISEQTNLLALNAAIEAARAGEMGRGFAVVADEVRELSRRTNESTEQIQSQIESLITRATSASKKMTLLQENGHEAIEVVQNNTDAFMQIKGELDQITEMATQIAVSAEEQTNVSDEINQRIHSIRDDSEHMYDQGSGTLESTKVLLDNGKSLKANIEVFHFN